MFSPQIENGKFHKFSLRKHGKTNQKEGKGKSGNHLYRSYEQSSSSKVRESHTFFFFLSCCFVVVQKKRPRIQDGSADDSDERDSDAEDTAAPVKKKKTPTHNFV
jgi:hypothetical protein